MCAAAPDATPETLRVTDPIGWIDPSIGAAAITTTCTQLRTALMAAHSTDTPHRLDGCKTGYIAPRVDTRHARTTCRLAPEGAPNSVAAATMIAR